MNQVESVLRSNRDLLVLLGLFLILAKDYFWISTGLRVEWLGISVIALTFGYVGLSNREHLQVGIGHVVVVVLVLVSWIASSVVAGKANSSSYFAAFMIAMMIRGINPRFINSSLTAIVALNVTIQLIEFLSGQFLFAYVDEDNLYDEETLAVGDGTLRAKGFFASPLNALSVAMSVAFLNPASPTNWFLLAVSAVLGQGRLGLGVGVLGLLICLLAKTHTSGRNRRVAVFHLLGASGLLFLWAFYLASEDALQRMLEATSADNSQNISRLYFWGRAIEELLDYPPLNLIFGRPGYIKALEGGTESDWLRIWLDNGFLCVLAFLLPLAVKAVRSGVSRSATGLYAAVACFFVMAVFPHAQSMPNGTLTWLFLLGALGASPPARRNPQGSPGAA